MKKYRSHQAVGLTLICAASLAACNDGAQNTSSTGPTSLGAADNSGVPISSTDLTRICKAAQAFTVGRGVETGATTMFSDDTVRLSYTRDDGTSFRYDCRVDGDTVRTRMIDEAGFGSGPGQSSGRGSTTKFELEPDAVQIMESFPDGSSDEGSIHI